MSTAHLMNVDLNLLVALDVLLEERHITRSANRLNITQSAMSRRLNRLRQTFDDLLIFSTPNGYVLTSRGTQLVGPVKDILHKIQGTLSEPTFDPEMAKGEFKICTMGYGEIVVVPKFMEILSQETNDVEITIIPRNIYSNAPILEDKAEILFGARLGVTSNDCTIKPLFEDKIVCIMSEGHPLANCELTLDGYLDYPHSIIHTSSRSGSYVDNVLAQLGHKRKIQKRSPNWGCSLLSLFTTNLLATVPERMGQALAKSGSLVIKKLPYDIPPSKYEMLWHNRYNDDPRHKWFREKFIEAAQPN